MVYTVVTGTRLKPARSVELGPRFHDPGTEFEQGRELHASCQIAAFHQAGDIWCDESVAGELAAGRYLDPLSVSAHAVDPPWGCVILSALLGNQSLVTAQTVDSCPFACHSVFPL